MVEEAPAMALVAWAGVGGVMASASMGVLCGASAVVSQPYSSLDGPKDTCVAAAAGSVAFTVGIGIRCSTCCTRFFHIASGAEANAPQD